MTLFGRTLPFLPDPDEEEALQALMAPPAPLAPAPKPVAAPAPTAPPPPAAAAPAPTPAPTAPLPTRQMPAPYTPPPRAGGNGGGLFSGDDGAAWAALLDVALNKGHGTPQIIAQAAQLPEKRRQQQLEEDYKAAQINALNRRGLDDPYEQELKRRRLDQADRRLTAQEEQMRQTAGEYLRRKQETEAKYGAGSLQVKQLAQMYRQLGVPENILGTVEGMSMDTARVAAPSIREQGTIAQSPQLAQAAGDKAAAVAQANADVKHINAPEVAQDEANKAVAAMTAQLPYQREKARETAAGTQEGQGDYRERRLRWEKSRAFSKDNETELAIGGLINEINQAGGAAPADFAERFKGPLAARGIDPARLEAWQAKQMVLEMWARKQTGAAISASEGEKFDIQTGMNATASPEQVEAAYSVMERLIQRQLRAQASDNEAAPDIIFNAGVSDDPYAYLGRTRAETQASAKQPVPRVGMPGKQTATAEQPPAAAPRRPRKAPTASPEAQREAAEFKAAAGEQDVLPVAPAGPKVSAVKRPGMTLMRNPSTGSQGWVKDADVQDKIRRLHYEVVR